MAANLFTPCDPVTSWYDFPYSLSWSNNCEVAEVLSDIPFISVGILVFGASALLLVVKRIPLSAIWLFSSALLAFVAAIADLGKILADELLRNTAFTTSEPVIRAREILFALSIGFRLLFYWSYAAEPPRKDLSARSTQGIPNIRFCASEYTHRPHSGNWMRWGLPGKLLGSGLLATIMTVTVLQIVWRLVPQFHQYGGVYATDAVLELLVSFLLLLKLLLNTVASNAPDRMLVHTFRESLAPILGLLVNIATGVGGLLSFAFTESTVGRLLQAIEVYVVVVFIVSIVFLKHCDILLASTSPDGKKCTDIAFALPEPVRGSTFRITPPCIETPRMSTILGTATQNMESSREVLRRSARRSLNHVASWVSSKVSRNRSRHGDERVKLWNAEFVKVDSPHTRNVNTELRASILSSTQESKGCGEPVREAPANHLSIASARDEQTMITRSMESSIDSDRILHSSRVEAPQYATPHQIQTGPVPVISSVSPSYLSGVKHGESVTMGMQVSPVYGLGGVQTPASAANSRTSLDELLKQQSQLDQSIEALKLFSARTSTDSNAVLSAKSVELTRSHSIGQRTISSEVSLSSFPVPPWLATPIPSLPSSPGLSTIKRIRGDRRVRLAAARTTPIENTYTSFPPKTSVSPVDIPSSPHFNIIGEENECLSGGVVELSRPGSGGSRYNVTSFIGDLATPDELKEWPRESTSSLGTIQTNLGSRKVVPHALPIPAGRKGLPSTVKHSPLALSSTSRRDIDDSHDGLPYRIDEQTSHPSTVAISPPKLVTDARPHLMGNGASVPSIRSQLDRQTVFVRPRPPPLDIKSYAEQNAGKPRVQVLADD